MSDWGPLGDVLRAKASMANQENVRKLVDRARELLKLVRDTFPAYTLHDDRHAENVIALMGRLAAPRIAEMTGLEAALLVLAAYFHDAGMAYTRDELRAIPSEPEFRRFLDTHDEAYLATQRNGGEPPDEVITEYCRSRHAVRVRRHLAQPACLALLTWDNTPIDRQLELVCVSHNEPVGTLHDPRFKTGFLYEADLRFCAVLLRLADILDLDETRAPAVIHEHLSLPSQASAAAAVSDQHWRRHIAARGFRFPPQQTGGYTLQFAAVCEEPAVEHGLRQFLTVVEDELRQCRDLIDSCGDRWRDLPLPALIAKDDITSRGYKYGDFRFDLDREAVLDLFTGEQLYDDPCAFVRELLQNALDAVRARAHLFGHESGGIRVWCWEDEGGYIWVRVDDDGIGMDEESLRKYFMRIGRSYYRSAEFEADLARHGPADRPFGVISRFGIGVLSCFMAGDEVELTTRRAEPGRDHKPVRLSINRRDDYFVLQDDDHEGREMPGRDGPEPAFLGSPGTRIAVRINPSRAEIGLEKIVERVRSYVFAPPARVSVNGSPVGTETWAAVTQQQISAVLTAEVDTSTASMEEGSTFRFEGRPKVVAVPINLTEAGAVPDVSGQLTLFMVLPFSATESQNLRYTASLNANRRVSRGVDRIHVEILSGRGKGILRSAFALREFQPALPLRRESTRLVTWGHNGIALPGSPFREKLLSGLPTRGFLQGAVSLSGRLRPDLTISRASTKALAFHIYSALHLACRRAITEGIGNAAELTGAHDILIDELEARSSDAWLSAGTAWADPLVSGQQWSRESILSIGRSDMSIDEIRRHPITAESEIMLLTVRQEPPNGYDFYDQMRQILIHFFLDVEHFEGYSAGLNRNYQLLRLRSSVAPAHPEGAAYFRPLFAVPNRKRADAARSGLSLNSLHPLAKWLFRHAAILAAEFPVPFNRVFRLAPQITTGDLHRAMDQVKRGRPDIAPPAEAYVYEDEEGYWWSP